MSNSRFIKFIPSKESNFFLEHHPNAFLLLALIATRARRISGNPDGLEIGEARIGDYSKCGIESRKKYRTALELLIKKKIIEKVETCRTRQKSATGTTTVGTKVKLLRSDIWDINSEDSNHRLGHRGATEGPPMGHEQERIRKKKNDKKIKTIHSQENLILRKENVFTSDIDHQDLLEKHGVELVEEAYHKLSEWKKDKSNETLKKATDIGRIKHWVITAVREQRVKLAELAQREARVKKSENVPLSLWEENKKYAEDTCKNISSMHCELKLNSHEIFFVPTTGQQQPFSIKYNDNGFKGQLQLSLEKKGFKKI